MIQLALILTQVLLTADAPLPVVAVTASSEKPNAPARALIDGKRDTSWQPDADGAYGLGQWIRVDLGTVFDVTSIKLHNGIQRIEGGADQFCRNARAGRVTVDGTVFEIGPRERFLKARPDYVVDRGTYLEIRRAGDRCAALVGGQVEVAGDGSRSIGSYSCVVYGDRPRTCRDFTLGSGNCLDARRRVGLSLG